MKLHSTFSAVDYMTLEDRDSPAAYCQHISRRIAEAEARIREWQTLMNVFDMKGWTDPLTGDVHVIIRADKLKVGDHIADAIERKAPTHD